MYEKGIISDSNKLFCALCKKLTKIDRLCLAVFRFVNVIEKKRDLKPIFNQRDI
ncbi:hypothetical protein Mh1961_11230 [Mannheimia haemolytica]